MARKLVLSIKNNIVKGTTPVALKHLKKEEQLEEFMREATILV